MAEYKLKGLSCSHCASEMEEEINKLENGNGSKILYNSSKLILNDRVDIKKVEKILSSDGASIMKDHSSEHTEQDAHEHSHETSARMKFLLPLSAILFAVAIYSDTQLDNMIPVLIYILSAAISGYQTFLKGVKNLFKLKFNINTLMTI